MFKIKNFQVIILCFAFLLIFTLASGSRAFKADDNIHTLIQDEYKLGRNHNEDGTLTLGNNSALISMYEWGDEKRHLGKKIADDGVSPPVDGKVRKGIYFGQTYEGYHDYLFFVVEDYKVRDFIVDGKNYLYYPVSFEGNDFVYIETELILENPEANSVLYFFVPDPYKKFDLDFETDEDISYSYISDRLHRMNNMPRSIRLSLRDTFSEPEGVIWDDSEYIPLDPRLSNVYLLDRKPEPNSQEAILADPDNQYAIKGNIRDMVEAKANQEVTLMVSNWEDVEMEYAVFQFIDWKQTPFDDGQLVKYFKVPPHQTAMFPMKMPDTDVSVPYQVYSFASPFSNSLFKSAFLYNGNTMRIWVNP